MPGQCYTEMNRFFDDLTRTAGDASTKLSDAREVAKGDANAAAADIFAKLREALKGDVIRGMRPLTPPWVRPAVSGARVHADVDHGLSTDLPRDGREALVILDDATLVWASHDGKASAVRPAGDILAQDFEPLVRTLQKVLERHVLRAQRTAESYARVVVLARRVSEAVGFDF